ncbi:MAG: PQQ-binding-like beta-propeller repeat protein, partial [Phycisphaerae bacterium]|nr:PQQ-binding-like beta-propeller repeat protein [Phycisphaerae bacterium]
MLLAAAAIAAICSAQAQAQAQWYNPEWVCRRSVKVAEVGPEGKQPEIASVVFSPEGLLASDGRDIRVLTKDGKEVPRIVIEANRDGKCHVLFRLSAGTSEYFVYYGNIFAKEPTYQWKPETGIVMLEVFDPPLGFVGDTFEDVVDAGGKRTGLGRDAWKRKKRTAWPRIQPLATRHVAKTVQTTAISASNAVFIFRIEVKAGDKPFLVKKLGQGIVVDDILFIDNINRTMSPGSQPADVKMLALEPGIHTVEAWGGCLRHDSASGKYVPFTHDTVYRLAEAKTEVGKPEYVEGSRDIAYGKVELQLMTSGQNYWLQVSRAESFPPGKVPRDLLDSIDKFERDNWAAEWRAYGGGPRHTKPCKTNVVLPLGLARKPYSASRWEPKTQPVVYDGVTLVCGVWGKMYARGLWASNFWDPVTSTPACIGGRVFFGSHNYHVYGLDWRNGRAIWKVRTGFIVKSSPAVWRGRVYIGSSDHHLYAISGASGKVLWKFKTGGWIESSPAVAGGVVYFGSYDHYFYAVDATTGKLRWKFKTGYDCVGSPVIAGGNVIFASDDGRLYCLNRTSGVKRWQVDIGGYSPGMPAVFGPNVYVASTKGKIFAINIAGGQKVWEANGLGEMRQP